MEAWVAPRQATPRALKRPNHLSARINFLQWPVLRLRHPCVSCDYPPCAIPERSGPAIGRDIAILDLRNGL